MDILRKLEFDKRCMRLTAAIGALAAGLCVTVLLCRCCKLPIAVNQLFALIGSLCACGMLSLYAVMAAGAFAKAVPERAGSVWRIADAGSLSLKLFFLLATCGAGLPIACAALIIDAVITRFMLPVTLKAESVTI